jgi:hypothetical protein
MPGHNDWYRLTAGTPEDFRIAFDPYPFREMSIPAAGAYTAGLIRERYGDNIWIAMSGGYDSEFVANCFYDNKIPFTPIIWRVHDWPESDYAIRWCSQRGINPHIIDRDILSEPILGMLQKTAARMHTDHFLCTVNIALARVAEKHGGVLLSGTGVAMPEGIYPEPMGENTHFAEHDFFLEMWSDKHPGSFLIYTVELFHALLKKTDTALHTQDAKALVYDLNFRPKLSPLRLLDRQRTDFLHKNHEYSAGTFADLIIKLEHKIISS